MNLKFYNAQAQCDWSDSQYPCFTTGVTWNGFGTPYFDLDTAKKVISEVNAAQPSEAPITYDSKNDKFILPHDDENEEVTATMIKVDGKDIKTYPVGAWSWSWYVEPNNTVEKKPKMK